MARLFDDASSQYFNINSAAASSFPLTVACWFRTDENPPSAVQSFISLGGANNNQLWFNISTAGAVGAGVQWGPSSFSGSGATGNTVSDTGWHHACAQYQSGTTPYVRAILDADFANQATNTANDPTFPSVSETWIGGGGAGANPTSFHSGDIADAAYWSVLLTNNEISSLANGVPASRIRPDAFLGYWTLQEPSGNIADYSGNQLAATETNGPIAGASHVPLMPTFAFLSSRIAFGWPAAAGGGSTLSRNLQDTITLTENLQRDVWVTRDIQDTLTLVENLLRDKVATRELQDTVTLTENLDRVRLLHRDIQDSLTLTDQITRDVWLDRLLTDTITLTENLTYVGQVSSAAVTEHHRLLTYHKWAIRRRLWRKWKDLDDYPPQ